MLERTGYDHQSKNPCVKAAKRQTFVERYGTTNGFGTQGDISGERNPFYGKHHTEETKQKLRKWTPEESRRRRKARRFAYGLLWRWLRTHDQKKIGKCYELLGYTPQQLREHLEWLFKPGMTWENHGRHGWHVDHVRPVSSFAPGTSPSIVNALENLQPLWAHENLSKGAKHAR